MGGKMGNGMWKQEARDSIEEPSLSNENMEDERPQESIYTNRNASPLGRISDDYNQQSDEFVLYGVNPRIDLFGRVGLHCYNLRKEEEKYVGFNKYLVDYFFRGEMPEWVREDALTGRDKLQYYEMKDRELEEENEWLQLYVELAVFSKWKIEVDEMKDAKPFEMKKVVVRTRENVESWKKVKAKAKNAIFYISFKTRCGRDWNCIVRKTTDGHPGHYSLEVKPLM